MTWLATDAAIIETKQKTLQITKSTGAFSQGGTKENPSKTRREKRTSQIWPGYNFLPPGLNFR